MTQAAKTVDHIGRVQEITPDEVIVCITSNSACAGCHAQGVCGMSGSSQKTVVVQKPNHDYQVGEDVKVILRQSLGFRALFLGYILPFFLVLLSLILLSVCKVHEAMAGLISLSVLVPYYLALYGFKNRVSKRFTFDIEPVK